MFESARSSPSSMARLPFGLSIVVNAVRLQPDRTGYPRVSHSQHSSDPHNLARALVGMLVMVSMEGVVDADSMFGV